MMTAPVASGSRSQQIVFHFSEGSSVGATVRRQRGAFSGFWTDESELHWNRIQIKGTFTF